jgi:hypothetical protein
VPTFVLTHDARAPLRMAGGTEFRFVTDGFESARIGGLLTASRERPGPTPACRFDLR